MRGRCWLSRLSRGAERRYDVLHLHSNGTTRLSVLTIADIISSSQVHARDLIALSLQESKASAATTAAEASMFVVRPPPVILPRGNSIVLALGNFKGVIQADQCFFFDSHLPVVYQSVMEVAADVKVRAPNTAFEMSVLESVLSNVCSHFGHRTHLYQGAVSYILDDLAHSPVASERLQHLIPLKDGISSFSIRIEEVLETMRDMLDNEEDMVGLLLSAQRDSSAPLAMDQHMSVELLFEHYHRQLVLLQQRMNYLRKTIKTRQELASISLDVYRNQLMQLELKLSVLTVGLGSCTAIAGLFGMNLVSGMEHSAWAFPLVALGSAIVFLGFTRLSFRFLRSLADLRQQSQPFERDFEALQSIFINMGAIEHAIRWSSAQGKTLSRDNFRVLVSSSSSSHFSRHATDLVFDMLESSGMGSPKAVGKSKSIDL